jgi:signal transduction histidine kinase
MWLWAIIPLAVACLLPLIIIAIADLRTAHVTVTREERLLTERLASNAKRTIVHFLEVRLDALTFTAHEVGVEALKNPIQLTEFLSLLKHDLGGFTDLGLVDASACQIAYSGPYNLIGKDYSNQEWFVLCRKHGTYISVVYRGHRNVPHFVIAVGTTTPDGSYYALRATLDTQRLVSSLTPYASGEDDDVFLLSRSGVVQTSSRRHGDVLTKALLEVPPVSDRTRSHCAIDKRGIPVCIGYAYITTKVAETPFILVLSRPRTASNELLSQFRTNRLLVVASSSLGILLVIAATSSFLLNRLYDADRIKGTALLSMQETSRLASLGRLSTGVAHEINNPLAVINEAAGYIKDLLSLEQRGSYDSELLGQTEAILESVERCGTITKQLLGFARDLDLRLKPIRVAELIQRVLSFHRKEAEYKGIAISFTSEDIPEIISDPGRLQQIFLNLIGNAFQAMVEGDILEIKIRSMGAERISITIADTGCGIPSENLQRIFEPFFTTKGEGQGTGLGLSITYSLVRNLRGDISVESKVGVGTSFTVDLPVRHGEEEEVESTVS